MKKIIVTCFSLLITSFAIAQTAYVKVSNSNLFDKPDVASDVQVVLHAGCKVSKVDLVSLQKSSNKQWVYINVKLKGEGEYEGYVLKTHLIKSKYAVNTRNYVYKPSRRNPKSTQIFWSESKEITRHLQANAKDKKHFIGRKFSKNKKGIFYVNHRGRKVYIQKNK